MINKKGIDSNNQNEESNNYIKTNLHKGKKKKLEEENKYKIKQIYALKRINFIAKIKRQRILKKYSNKGSFPPNPPSLITLYKSPNSGL